MQQFLNRLPKTVIKQGQIIDVRDNIEQHLSVSLSHRYQTISYSLFHRVNKKLQYVVIGKTEKVIDVNRIEFFSAQ